MSYSSVLESTNTYLCLVMAFIWTFAYAYAGYQVLSKAEPPKFLVRLWAVFMILNVEYLFLYLLIVFQTFKHEEFLIYLVILADILYAIAHWMFSWQYFQSAIDIESVITHKKAVKRKCRNYINAGMFALIIISYLVSLAMELKRYKKGTFVYGESSTVLFVFYGLITTIILCYAVLKIRGIIARFPHLQSSNKMMSAHLIMFSLNEVLTIIQVVVPYILYKNAETVNQ